MVKRKYTRKQLRQPDEFISFSMKVWEAIRNHASRVVVMGVVAILIMIVAANQRPLRPQALSHTTITKGT